MSSDKLKILLAGDEVCGFIKTYQIAFQNSVMLQILQYIKKTTFFSDYKYTYNLSDYD